MISFLRGMLNILIFVGLGWWMGYIIGSPLDVGNLVMVVVWMFFLVISLSSFYKWIVGG